MGLSVGKGTPPGVQAGGRVRTVALGRGLGTQDSVRSPVGSRRVREPVRLQPGATEESPFV